MTRRLLGLATLAFASALAACSSPPPQHLTVLHTNDHHGRFWRNAQGEAGLAARKTLVDAVRAEVRAQGGQVLLLDAGDVNTGVPESDLQEAEPDFRGMSLLGYDAMAVGNHEFDRGQPTQQRQRSEWSSFAWLSANVQRDGTPVFEPYRIFQLGALRVAVLGLTTEDTAKMDTARRYPGLQFEPAITAAQRLVPQLRPQADVLIALSHLGHYVDGRHGVSAPGDVELARAVPGIDVVVGGHSHSLVCMVQENVRHETYEPGGPCAPDRQNGAWIVQAGDRGRFVGRADFEWRDGRLSLQRYRLLPVNLPVNRQADPSLPEDPQALQLLAPFQQRGDAGLRAPIGRVIGHLDGERASVRQRRTALGSFISAAMQDKAGADLALISSGGIRASLPEGEISQRDLLTVLPFGNRLVVVTLSGRELADYVLALARMTPGSGAFAQYSGLAFVFDGSAVRDIRIGGQPLAPERRYRMALPSFVAAGGDGYPDLRAHPGYVDTGFVDVAVLRDFIAARGGSVAAADFAP